MTDKPQSGFFWHVHHTTLVEHCYDYAERKRFVQEKKPEEEQELRLRLFQPVRGQLPELVISTGRAYAKAWKAYNEVRGDALRWLAYCETGATYAGAMEFHKEEISKLHDQECPNCPWDGKTIFPEEEN